MRISKEKKNECSTIFDKIQLRVMSRAYESSLNGPFAGVQPVPAETLSGELFLLFISLPVNF